jgi:replicative DNA helicase
MLTTAAAKQLPHDDGTEKGLLSSILINPDRFPETSPLLTGSDFFDMDHQRIWDSMERVFAEHQCVDPIQLAKDIGANGGLTAGASPANAIMELAVFTAVDGHAMHYAREVKRMGQGRQVVRTCGDVIEQMMQDGSTLELCKQAIEKMMADLDPATRHDVQFMAQLSLLAKESLETAAANPGITGLETGFARLDNLTNGFQPERVYTLAARPGMGKSALACNIANHIGLRLAKNVLFVSLEMSAIELTERLLCSLARCSSHAIKRGNYEYQTKERVATAAEQLIKSKVAIADSPYASILDVSAMARAHKKKWGLDLLVIDYLQLLVYHGDETYTQRVEQVGQQMRSLKHIARELEIPVLLLAQMNRQTEQRTDHRPILPDLRESGSIEQDSDCVMFLYCDHEHDDTQPPELFELIVRKQRNGPVGTCEMQFLKDYSLFSEKT